MRDDIVAWIGTAADDGRTVVSASHDFDELAANARAALTVRLGATVLYDLPQEPDRRAALLDALARGAAL